MDRAFIEAQLISHWVSSMAPSTIGDVGRALRKHARREGIRRDWEISWLRYGWSTFCLQGFLIPGGTG